MSLSAAVTQGTTTKRTMRLLGHIGKAQILILVDSGTSGNFISNRMVEELQLPVQALQAVHVTVANGEQLVSQAGLSGLQWGVQDSKFTTPVRFLPLKCYDMILGMEWLESCNGGKCLWTGPERK